MLCKGEQRFRRLFRNEGQVNTFSGDGVVNGSKLDPGSTVWQQAIGACTDLQPAGFMGVRRSAQQQERALKFAQCIRENGVKDFPDPDPNGPIIDTTRMPGNPAGLSIPGLRAAQEQCRVFVADFVTGPQ
ncbi:MAG: hypothetical protein IT306_17555 [Chloroflexi bacterium]|nr:hypothetical protein [Chloroflexota bacterium]